MPIDRVKTKGFEWINIYNLKGEDIDFLKKNYNFHPLDLKDCQSVSQRPKLDIYDDYIFMVLHFPCYIRESRKVNFKEVHFFVGKNYIVTVKKGKVETLHNYLKEFSSGRIKFNGTKDNPFHFLYDMLEKLYADSLPIIDIISQNLSSVEEELFSENHKQLAQKIAFTRRNILNFRKMLEPQIKIFDKLIDLHKKFVPKGISVYFDDIQDYLERTRSSLDNYKDIIEGLGSTHESLISQRTNEVMKILTVISVALLPLTLIASIYGMNISGLPFAEHPLVIWIFFIVLIFFISLVIFISHKRNIL